jgi:curved DNA-binding protein CbpA
MGSNEALIEDGPPGGEDLYRLLGVSPDASQEDLKRAWHRQAARLHPDASQSEAGRSRDTQAAVRDFAMGSEALATDNATHRTERFLAVHRAYRILSDPTRRAHYDAQLALRSLHARARRPALSRIHTRIHSIRWPRRVQPLALTARRRTRQWVRALTNSRQWKQVHGLARSGRRAVARFPGSRSSACAALQSSLCLVC